ncbi:AraC family transcriptional regulator [uncultured Coprobacter sp.]|uniref:helix-turn-helix domain-containing protein n=1 Tax=uncultured Coprobacter sp. TaxID=1720550 RepID=UPI002617DA0A|nr:AraC family transcriptional regulator [uncultured Coprobacter sp.]
MEQLILDHTLKEKLSFPDSSFPIQFYVDDLHQWPDWQVPLHWHFGYEIFSAINQKVMIQVGEKCLSLLPGESILIGGRQLHKYSLTDSTKECLCPNIVFTENILAPLTSTIFQKYFSPILNDSSLPYIKFSQCVSWQKQMLLYLFRVYEILSDTTTHAILDCSTFLSKKSISECPELEVHQNLLEFFKILYSHKSELHHSKIPPPDSKTQIRMQKMLQYIQKHFSETISLEDLAASANISRSEAGRCFQRYYADTPMSYLIRYRLQQAQRLLLTSTLSVKEISCKCGFSDISYFIKVFRKHMNQTPSEYRKIYHIIQKI